MNQTDTLHNRTSWLIAIVFIVGAIFIVRLFYVQVIRHAHYTEEAAKEHVSKFTIRAKRGLIYARDGQDGRLAPLVLNEPAYTVFADPRYVKDEESVVNKLREIAGGNTVKNFGNLLKNKESQYAVLARDINKKQADLIKKADLAGIGLQEYEKRVYPEGSLAAQTLGFVNGEGKGQYGIEQAKDDLIGGKDGLLKAVTDVHGIPISVGGEDNVQQPAVDGEDIVLTLDRNIQSYAEDALKAGLKKAKATKGSILIMDPRSGKIMAMANYPTFKPADYAKVTNYSAFQNAVVSDPYEPGSVIKPFTMGVGISENVIEPNSTYNNTGKVKVGDKIISNVLHDLMGTVSMTQVLEYSYNTGVVHVLKQLGGGDINMRAKNTLYNYYTKNFLFGRKTGIDVAGEANGHIVPPKNSYDNLQYANMSFGQGMSATVLQTASAFSALINGGKFYKPQVIDGYLNGQKVVPKESEIIKSDVLKPEDSHKVMQMLRDARNNSFLGDGDKKGYAIGGKTGTSQVFDPQTGKYSETETIGSYLGFGGRNSAEYVIMVRVDDSRIGGYSGSMAAAPIFTDVSNWLIDYLRIAPR